MNTELFPTVKCDSPRLAWIKRHNLTTAHNPELADDSPWSCWSCPLSNALDRETIGLGDTEADAIAEWAKLTGTRLWNEEALP